MPLDAVANRETAPSAGLTMEAAMWLIAIEGVGVV